MSATAGAADASLGENAPHRGPAEVDAFPFLEQFGEVSVVGALVTLGGQLHHRGSLGERDSVVGTAASVIVGQCGDALGTVGRQHPSGVAFTPSQQLGGLGDGHLAFQNGVEHVESCLFSLVQYHILHRMDIFADQLTTDRIVGQQQTPVNDSEN